MKRALKFLSIAGITLLLLGLASVVVLRVMFPPEKLRAALLEKARAALGREVEIEKVSIGLRGLGVEGFKLSERPAFKAGTFASVESIVVRPQLMPLLKGQLVVSQIRVVGPEAKIVKTKGGYNYSDLVSTASSGAWPTGFLFSEISLERAKLGYAEPGLSAELRVPSARVRGVAPSGSFPWSVELEFVLRQAQDERGTKVRELSGAFDAEGRADLASFDFKKLSASIDKGEARLGRVQAKLAAKVAGSDPATGEFRVSVGALKSEDLKTLAPVPPGLELPAAEVSGSFERKGAALRLDKLALRTAGLELKGSASWDGASAAFDFATNTFELSPLAAIHPTGRALKPSGRASFSIKGSGPPAAPSLSKLAASWKTDAIPAERLKAVSTAAAVGLPPSEGALEASYAKDVLTLKKLDASAGPVKAKASGKVALKGPLELTLETNAFSLSEAAKLAPGLAATKPQGKARLEASVSGTAERPAVRGVLTLEGVGGSYQGVTVDGVGGAVAFAASPVPAPGAASAKAPSLKGRLSGSPFELKLEASQGAKLEAKVDFKIDRLDAGALAGLAGAGGAEAKPAEKKPAPPPSGPPLKTSGRIEARQVAHPNLESGPLTLEWSLDGVTPDLKSIDGSAKLDIAAGRAKDLLKLAERKKTARALLMPLVAIEKARGIPGVNLPSVDNLPFDRVEGRYSFDKGVMTMRPFALEGPVLSARTEGSVDLPKELVDLKVAIRTAAMRPKLIVKGPMMTPKITPDLSELKEQAKEELQKKAKEELQKGAERLLKGLFK